MSTRHAGANRDHASSLRLFAAFLLPVLLGGALAITQTACRPGTPPKCDGKVVTHTFSFNNGSTQTATDGDDVIRVIQGPVTINAGAGNDTICVVGSHDGIIINGGPGDDKIIGGPGNDFLRGNEGKDVVTGGEGVDTITGGPGIDILAGGAGNDSLWGEGDNDILSGDDGNDWLWGGAGDDLITGGAGDDFIFDDDGDDDLRGGAGNDVLQGGVGADELDGGTGDDTAYLCGPASLVSFESVCKDPSCPSVPASVMDAYLPDGRRRSCAPTLELSISDGTQMQVPIPDKSTLMVPVGETLAFSEPNGPPEIERIALRGDRSILVELFNIPLLDADFDMYPNVGTSFDPFFFNSIQVRYPYARDDDREYSVTVDAAREQLGLSMATNSYSEYFSGAISARVYDLGECSFGVSWDDIASGVRAEIEPLTDELAGLSSLIEWVRLNDFYIRPILTNDGSDRIYVQIKLEVKVDISCCNTAKTYLALVLKPTTSNTLPLDLVVESYDVGVYDVNGVLLSIADRWFVDLDAMVNEYASDYIPDSLGQYLIDSLPVAVPGYIRARRMVMTSGGLEAVLAEDTDDPQYGGILAAGLGGLVCPSGPAPALQSPSNWWRNRGLP